MRINLAVLGGKLKIEGRCVKSSIHLGFISARVAGVHMWPHGLGPFMFHSKHVTSKISGRKSTMISEIFIITKISGVT